ncbi:transcription factor HES-5-like [Lates calcarifer]|uniref:Transcription factor HES-5-like n=1 Tax=Lates calcarifer TaxID=8187 RepID=A0AAJ7Q1G8_LATCA|nr:transcription factor HES-5-like [Lates calcarifer]
MAPVTQTGPEDKPGPVDSNKQRRLAVEKARRDRISCSIEQLRTLLDPERSGAPRLERVDVLELAVGLLRQRAVAPRVAPATPAASRSVCRRPCATCRCTRRCGPRSGEEIKRFYVRQRAALQRHVSGEQRRRTAARKRSGSRSAARCHGALWRPW